MDTIKIWTSKDIEHNKKDRQERLFASMETGFRNMKEIEKTVSKYDKLEIITSTDIQYLRRLLLKLREEERIILHIFNTATESFMLKGSVDSFKDLISEVVLRIDLLEEKEDYKEPEATEYRNLLSLLNGGLEEERRLEGVNQETLIYVVENKQLPPKAAMGIWVGERPEAWIFATHFGLDYAPFNKCFKMEDGRKLHSNDKPRGSWKTYKIEKILGIG